MKAFVAASILCVCLPVPATGDERIERIHQLLGEAGRSISERDAARATTLLHEVVRLERQTAEVDDLRLAESLALLAQMQVATGDLSGAEAVLAEAQQIYAERLGPLNPFSGLLFADLAMIHRARGDLRKGVLAMDRAVALAPPVDAPSAVACSAVYEAAGEWEKARRALEVAARLSPGDPIVSNNLAWAILSSPGASPADLERAEQLARSSVAARPDSVAAMDTLGLALVRVGRGTEAWEILRKALEAPPESLGGGLPHIQFHAALALEQSGGDPRFAATLAQAALNAGAPAFDAVSVEELLARLTSRLPEHSGRLDDGR